MNLVATQLLTTFNICSRLLVSIGKATLSTILTASVRACAHVFAGACTCVCCACWWGSGRKEGQTHVHTGACARALPELVYAVLQTLWQIALCTI